ncbi:hypothetical protein [Pseudonocardia pini]|uniref:hypothetical protein n=1 Tax=Pseudonocardia pini TaxID=2758030 RepID=UPI0015F11AB6|nr:hypothetical protein [Pseudonocardia pini]
MSEERVEALVLRWYARRGPGIVPRWLAAAREHLPEALPVRFGESEPLRTRFVTDADLVAAHAAADPLLFLRCTPPVHDVSLGAGSRGGPVLAHTLHALLDPADERVRRFALAVADEDTLYVSASVADQFLDDGTLYGPAGRQGEPFLAARGDWLGLPPSPPVWCWFGPAYARKVGRTLWTGGEWVPERFRARLDEVDPVRRHARRMPRGLRRRFPR